MAPNHRWLTIAGVVALVVVASAASAGVLNQADEKRTEPHAPTHDASSSTDGDDAETSDADEEGEEEKDVTPDEVVAAYNDLLDRVPELIREEFADRPAERERALAAYELGRDFLADQRIEIHVSMDEGEDVTHTVVTDGDARIVAHEAGTSDEEPTMRVSTDEETLRKIASADDPTAAALEAFERGDIDVEGVGIENAIRVGARERGIAAGVAG